MDPKTPPRDSRDYQRQQSGSSMTAYADDIECQDWLEEIELPQYAETFTTNCTIGGSLLSRKRLSQIRLKDFPHMNITDYKHQKKLIEHIQHTLEFTFHSPARKREVNVKMGRVVEDAKSVRSGVTGPVATSESKPKAKYSLRRRRSFDTAAWNSISKLRNTDQGHKVAADHLRAIHQGEAEVS